MIERDRSLNFGSLLVGLFSFLTILAFHHLADGDLWAKLILGSSILDNGVLLQKDIFAFTPTLPVYIDHEWGSGLIFFTFLKFFGPSSLMLLKMLLAVVALAVAARVALRQGCSQIVVLLLLLPAALGLLPGYVVVIRSHAFTYLFFALTLLCLEEIQRGKKWPIFAQIFIIIIWTNVHGGFVAGLGTVGVYTVVSIIRRQHVRTMICLSLACAAATLLNPYGIHFWETILPAVLHKRPNVPEWGPMPFFGLDAFIGFRVLAIIALLSFAAGWHKRGSEFFPGLIMLSITVFIAIRSRRHAPFFALACLAFLGNYVECAWQRFGKLTSKRMIPIRPAAAVLILYAIVAIFVTIRFLPHASLQVLAPIRFYPVREADILAQSGVTGNLVLPFDWGSYAAWRLYPKIKISIDGRYEAVYPESTFQSNVAFFFKTGADWDKLLRDYRVDFIILNLKSDQVTIQDLQARGYSPVWVDENYSGL
ncbi:MAG: hypothetical protein ABIR24_13205, partial [Verrucomicrobiota bacterium]